MQPLVYVWLWPVVLRTAAASLQPNPAAGTPAQKWAGFYCLTYAPEMAHYRAMPKHSPEVMRAAFEICDRFMALHAGISQGRGDQQQGEWVAEIIDRHLAVKPISLLDQVFIWWHRRRAQSHAASAAHKREQGCSYGHNAAWRESMAKWHLDQVERLSN
jgi:hypothetical protein